MSKILRIYFISSIVLGGLVYLFQKLGIGLPKILNNHLNDFLIIPIVLFVCLFVLRKIKNDKNYQISFPIILYLCTLYAILFEGYFPLVLERYTSDLIDVILYFISGIIFYLLQKK